jgi:hypothetical protein
MAENVLFRNGQAEPSKFTHTGSSLPTSCSGNLCVGLFQTVFSTDDTDQIVVYLDPVEYCAATRMPVL